MTIEVGRVKEINAKELNMNPVADIGEGWMLVTAGSEAGYNTMTAAWGHIGASWGRRSVGMGTAICYVRPQRYTKEFMDREDYYTLSFFPPEYKEKLTYLGVRSGRDEDKVANVGLTPVFEEGYTYFAEANMVLVCRKLYRAPIVEEGFVDKSVLDVHYPERDFHEMYVGEIVRVLVEE